MTTPACQEDQDNREDEETTASPDGPEPLDGLANLPLSTCSKRREDSLDSLEHQDTLVREELMACPD